METDSGFVSGSVAAASFQYSYTRFASLRSVIAGAVRFIDVAEQVEAGLLITSSGAACKVKLVTRISSQPVGLFNVEVYTPLEFTCLPFGRV